MKTIESPNLIITIRPDHIIEVRVKPDWDQPDTPESIIQNALLIQEAIGDEICGLMTFAPSLYISKEALEAFQTIDTGSKADAIVVDSVGARIFANLAFKFVKTDTPRKIFNEQAKAEKWLEEQLAIVRQSV